MKSEEDLLAETAREIYNTTMRRPGWDASWENAEWRARDAAYAAAREALGLEEA